MFLQCGGIWLSHETRQGLHTDRALTCSPMHQLFYLASPTSWYSEGCLSAQKLQKDQLASFKKELREPLLSPLPHVLHAWCPKLLQFLSSGSNAASIMIVSSLWVMWLAEKTLQKGQQLILEERVRPTSHPAASLMGRGIDLRHMLCTHCSAIETLGVHLPDRGGTSYVIHMLQPEYAWHDGLLASLDSN